jgi:hypothetical protein
MAAKLVVTKARGGTKITLVGTSGTELLTSKVFSEPRGKGATLRSLKGLLGDEITVEDQTATDVHATVAAPTSRPTTARIGTTRALRTRVAVKPRTRSKTQ